MTSQINVNRTQGFALVAAIFLIVVLAGLGLVAIRLASSQQQSINLTLLGSRAQAAANSGIEYGANRALTLNICLATINVPLTQVALKGFTVAVGCTSTPHSVIGSAPGCLINICHVYELTATSTYGTYGKPDYVSRTVSRTVSNVP